MCDSPYFYRPTGHLKEIPFACGRCPVCKRNRVNQWVFRLRQEEKVSTSSYFVTLTYNTDSVPISDNGFMTLDKRDFQLFMKRLREIERPLKGKKLRYYCAGEYGTKTKRPHYHLILFNLVVEDNLMKAWNKGDIHIGRVSGASIAYTAKYIDKYSAIPEHPRDDRVKEFSLMSKQLGANYLSQAIINYHKTHLDVNYVTDTDGHKIPMPRYYRDKIFSDAERERMRLLIEKDIYDAHLQEEARLKTLHGEDFDYLVHLSKEKVGRYQQFIKRQNKRE